VPTVLDNIVFNGHKNVQVGSGSGRIRNKLASRSGSVIQDYRIRIPESGSRSERNIYGSTMPTLSKPSSNLRPCNLLHPSSNPPSPGNLFHPLAFNLSQGPVLKRTEETYRPCRLCTYHFQDATGTVTFE
jgi:hypothetical protein